MTKRESQPSPDSPSSESPNEHRSEWSNPKAAVAVGGLLLSLIGNCVQYRSSEASSRRAQSELELQREQWGVERKLLQQELEASKQELDERRQKAESEASARKALSAKIDKIEFEITVWDDALLESRSELKFMMADLADYENAGKTALAEGVRKNIELQKDLIRTQEEERLKLIERRSSLERNR